MPVRVVVRDGESVKSAMCRLRRRVLVGQGRPSHKHRYGYYEKPSELKRKRAKRERLNSSGFLARHPDYILPLHVRPHSALHARSGPSNTLGH